MKTNKSQCGICGMVDCRCHRHTGSALLAAAGVVLSLIIIWCCLQQPADARTSLKPLGMRVIHVYEPNTLPTMDWCVKAYESWDATLRPLFRVQIDDIDERTIKVYINPYSPVMHKQGCGYIGDKAKEFTKTYAVEEGFRECGRCWK